jgi:signal transduction histidine kinase
MQAHPSSEKTDRAVSDADKDQVKNIIYTRIVQINGENDIVIVSGVLTPLSATTQTLSSSMLYISLLLIAMIIVLTLILYKEIAKPLSAINKAAKEIPQGKYEMDPKTNRYLEAQELNATLTDAAEDIQAADKAKRDLIANVSHDLRTPLTMISGYGEMMQDLPEEKTDENLQVIIDESKRLNALVNDLLDLSKMQGNKIQLVEEDMDLTALVETQMRKYDVYVMRDGFQIEKELRDSVMIHADPKRMEQVFNNFMTNAINYSGTKKHIIVREKITDGTVRIEVQDFGEGIDEKNLSKVWDRYYKIDKEHVRVSNGSGIGLALCKEILEMHHAKYGVDSKVGEGSIFWFAFPIIK